MRAEELDLYFVCNVHVLRLKTVFKLLSVLWRVFVALQHHSEVKGVCLNNITLHTTRKV